MPADWWLLVDPKSGEQIYLGPQEFVEICIGLGGHSHPGHEPRGKILNMELEVEVKGNGDPYLPKDPLGKGPRQLPGVKEPPPTAHSKLTYEEILGLKDDWLAGKMTIADLAEKYRISAPTVYNYAEKRQWPPRNTTSMHGR